VSEEVKLAFMQPQSTEFETEFEENTLKQAMHMMGQGSVRHLVKHKEMKNICFVAMEIIFVAVAATTR